MLVRMTWNITNVLLEGEKMEELIKKVNNSKIVFSIKEIEKIIKEYEEEFEKNIPVIIDKINEDHKKYKIKITTQELREEIQNIKNQPIEIVEEIDSKCIIGGIGTIVTIYNGIPSIALSMILNSIKTHNRLILCSENEFETSKILVEIMKTVLYNNNYSEMLVNTTNQYDDIYNCQEYIDKVIFIGSKYDYINLRKKLYVDIEYNGYGYISLFYDNDECINALENMKMYALKNFIELEIYNEDLQEAIDKINFLKLNDTVVIFSKDKQSIIKWILGIKANKIFVNKNPLANYRFEISSKSFIKSKDIK